MTEAPTAPASALAYPAPRAAGCPFDPPPGTTALREGEQPLSRVTLWDGRTVWLATRHAEHVALLRDPRISADVRHAGYPSVTEGLAASRRANRTFLTMDDPEHAAQRRLFTGEFTVRSTRALRPRIEARTEELLDAMEAAGPPADLVADFALPLPSLVICELLGVPYADHDFFQRCSAAMLRVDNGPEATLAASRELLDYLGELLERKAADPGDDLLSRTAERLRSGEADREELAKQARLLLVAGHETTANMIALGTCALLQHPEQLAVVRDGTPEQVGAAVEELLRYLTIVHMGRARVALADVEVGGQVIRAGDGVICATPLANRDPRVFDDPDRLDVTRQARRHVAFGSGPHQCLGQNLARVELELAYPALLRRFPGLRLDCPLEEVPFRDDMLVYGVHRLPVAW